jgi:hypothetical protein
MLEQATVENWADSARQQFDIVRAQASNWDEKLRTFTREQPLMALACALAGGYLLARLASRVRS